MPDERDSHTVLLDINVVRRGWDNLIAVKVHPTFAGYLCVRREARAKNSSVNLQPNFKSFFDQFMKVEGAPDVRPYLMPFAESRGPDWSPLFNRNVAGSYAPSSLRDVSPFLQVVNIQGAGRKALYSLTPKHTENALKSLLFDNRLGALSLAIFLYRDYGLQLEPLDKSSLLNIFRDEFGLRSDVKEEDTQFDLLFYDDSNSYKDLSLFLKATV